ncbi:hypothetical protein OVA24_13090 [Luteolibacter sp. SL250]|uniref:hypothetical protein n=1 Tax=Luteolibacter sp. SL250 TaxID=2995170 RepID=UPI00226DD154|nr:hypothetical protein [Luteolibacter sp. SL250]WAC18172.1 hypothetical protein OVA24_13090 [Luteolibacter sp. SL250]
MNHLRSLTGSYYRILGWIDLACSAIALGICYWTGHLAITFFFTLCFWLGSCLKRGVPAARKWAIAIPIIVGTMFAIALIFPGLNLRLAPWGIDHTHPAFLPLAVIDLVVLAIPGLMLSGDRGLRAFTGEKLTKQAGTCE